MVRITKFFLNYLYALNLHFDHGMSSAEFFTYFLRKKVGRKMFFPHLRKFADG